jgi:DNA-3-methyladenine glycosylase
LGAVTPRRLQRRFFARPAQVVARALLGKLLVHGTRSGRIVETEAYLGPEDLASHARFGRTARNRAMFGPGGLAYVYLCYGIHEMFNVVTGRDGDPQAVLLRAIEPVAGVAGGPASGRGPGKLTRVLGLSRAHDGHDLVTDHALFVATDGARVADDEVAVGPRVGVDYAGGWAAAPLRYRLCRG